MRRLGFVYFLRHYKAGRAPFEPEEQQQNTRFRPHQICGVRGIYAYLEMYIVLKFVKQLDCSAFKCEFFINSFFYSLQSPI